LSSLSKSLLFILKLKHPSATGKMAIDGWIAAGASKRGWTRCAYFT